MTKRKHIQRQYQRLYQKIEMFAQDPGKFRQNPTLSDVRRLEKRYQTIHEYDKILRRYQRSVAGFNARYQQNVELPEPHIRITTGTLQTLIDTYEKWKKYRRKFVRGIPKEGQTMMSKLLNYVDSIIHSFVPNPYTGSLSERDEMFLRHAVDLKDRLNELAQAKSAKTVAAMRRMRDSWEELEEAVNKYIYNSNQPDIQEEAFSLICFIITGDGDYYSYYSGVPEEDMVYE